MAMVIPGLIHATLLGKFSSCILIPGAFLGYSVSLIKILDEGGLTIPSRAVHQLGNSVCSGRPTVGWL